MFRIILILLIIYLLYVLLKRIMYKKPKVHGPRAGNNLPPGEMVECTKCQTFVLRSNAIEKGGKYYCSKSCIL